MVTGASRGLGEFSVQGRPRGGSCRRNKEIETFESMSNSRGICTRNQNPKI